MKSRKKNILANKQSAPSINKRQLDKPRRLNLSSVSFKQNLEFISQQANLFRKPSINYGDADTLFKQSLRTYDYFDFRQFNRKRKSSINLNNVSQESLKPKTQRGKKKAEEKPKPENNLESFYSPTQTLTALSGSSETELYTAQTTTRTLTIAEDTKEDMAEDAYIADFETDEAETTGDEAEEIKEVEDMIDKANQDLDEMIQDSGPEGEEESEDEGLDTEGKGDAKGSFFKFDPASDAAVLKELEEAEKQAKTTAKIIEELKQRVTELLKKDKQTEAEAKELEQKNKELKTQMILFEEKTKRIQFLLNQSNLFENMIAPDTPLQTQHAEDVLPKVIVCGLTENNIPKLILCDEKKGKLTCKGQGKAPKEINIPMSCVPKFTKRLNDSYTMQERLANENADLEDTRYKLQSDLLCKDQTIEYLQRKLCTIQSDMKMLCKENAALNERLQGDCGSRKQSGRSRRSQCGKNKGPCPAEIEGRLMEYSETTKNLEKQLYSMENDVKCMQSELVAVQAEREQLEQQKKCCAPPPCMMPPCLPMRCSPCIVPCADIHLKELKEQYCQLQDDFKSKVTEVGGLRADNEKLKCCIKDTCDAKQSAEEKVKELERTLKALRGDSSSVGSKEQMVELEQQLVVAKQRFREAQDELDELRSFVEDQQAQLDDYRNKYLETQQELEEQKRHIDILEMDANRVNEQVNIEIQRVKGQFQEKLQELLPLPDLLETTQLKLQEAQQMHLLAERNNEALNRDLQLYKDKITEITDRLNQTEQNMNEDEKQSLAQQLEEYQKRCADLEEEIFNLHTSLDESEQKLSETDRQLQSKLHEIAQLDAQLESVREESARQVSRNKERCETVRRSMQNQISDMERQLAQARAQAKTFQKDRDEIRQKMQAQISNLHENFEDAQMRIRSLQGHVNYLKVSSFKGVERNEGKLNAEQHDLCACGMDM